MKSKQEHMYSVSEADGTDSSNTVWTGKNRCNSILEDTETPVELQFTLSTSLSKKNPGFRPTGGRYKESVKDRLSNFMTLWGLLQVEHILGFSFNDILRSRALLKTGAKTYRSTLVPEAAEIVLTDDQQKNNVENKMLTTRYFIEERIRRHYNYPKAHPIRNNIRKHRILFEACCLNRNFRHAVLTGTVYCSADDNIVSENTADSRRKNLSHQLGEQYAAEIVRRPEMWDQEFTDKASLLMRGNFDDQDISDIDYIAIKEGSSPELDFTKILQNELRVERREKQALLREKQDLEKQVKLYETLIQGHHENLSVPSIDNFDPYQKMRETSLDNLHDDLCPNEVIDSALATPRPKSGPAVLNDKPN